MYDTRFKGSFKAVPIYVYKPCSIRKRTLGSISCNTTTSRPLWPIPLNWVPEELLQDSDLSSVTIGPHWPSSYPEYLSPHQDKDEQRRVVWARLLSQHSKLASWLSEQNKQYQALRQSLNPRTTQVGSSHDPLYRDSRLVMLQTVKYIDSSSNIKSDTRCKAHWALAPESNVPVPELSQFLEAQGPTTIADDADGSQCAPSIFVLSW